MTKAVKKIVIVGGGTAGWLTAAILAAEHQANQPTGLDICLIESPQVATVGVGEGTWPTMRATLQRIGISETVFFRECDASFKQGSKFCHWTTGSDQYYHPFMLPIGYEHTNLVPHWLPRQPHLSFTQAVAFQAQLCEQHRAPKDIATPEYDGITNYGYHLDAVKFAQLLQHHCTEKLGVRHIVDHVQTIENNQHGDIAAVRSGGHGRIDGDLFVDCSGSSSLLLGQHFDIPFISKKSILFNDRALAVQVPYTNDQQPILSHTLSTAQQAGWIWDIGLPTRRGIGHVYASDYISDSDAEQALRDYIRPFAGKQADTLSVRQLHINPGHRQVFWHRNCVAVGMAAGFLEPLEASAMVLIELAADMLSEQMPASREAMDIVAHRFNDRFSYHWQRIIDFLKLHYVLSQRQDSPYWRDNRRADTVPDSLQQLLTLWRWHAPWHGDFDRQDEVFSAASYQYVLYGMGFETAQPVTSRQSHDRVEAELLFKQNQQIAEQLLNRLPTNRAVIEKIYQHGMQKV